MERQISITTTQSGHPPSCLYQGLLYEKRVTTSGNERDVRNEYSTCGEWEEHGICVGGKSRENTTLYV